MELRKYQQEAVDAVYRYLRDHDDNPCVVIPTAGGKTPILATIVRDTVKKWNGRILILSHVKELLSQAAEKIREQREQAGITEPKNLEEQAISLVGLDIYERLVKGYTEKQWGRPCAELPAFIIQRLPVRFTFDNNYFNARFQGVPIGGYTRLVERMLHGIEIELNEDYLQNKNKWDAIADRVIYTGPIDAYFYYRLGHLQYRSIRFETEVLDIPNFQGNAVVNYTDRDTPFTRVIEHKHFEFGTQAKTVISREFSSEWQPGEEPYYPVNDEKNHALYQQYRALAEREAKVLFGGRLGEYRYYDMDTVIASALKLAETM